MIRRTTTLTRSSVLSRNARRFVRPLSSSSSSTSPKFNDVESDDFYIRWRQRATVPNALTFGRILATPYLCHLIVDGRYKTAVLGCFVAGIGDWFDGWYARKYDAQSVFGSFLDPLADKIFVGGIFAALTYAERVPIEFFTLVVGRDALLIAGSFAYRYATKDPNSRFFAVGGPDFVVVEPTLASKVNTVLQMMLLGLVLVDGCELPIEPAASVLHAWLPYGFYAVAGTTVLSGLSYVDLGRMKMHK